MKPQSTNKPIPEAPGHPVSPHHTDPHLKKQGDEGSPVPVAVTDNRQHTRDTRDPTTVTNSLVQTSCKHTLPVNGYEGHFHPSALPNNTACSPSHSGNQRPPLSQSTHLTPTVTDNSNSGDVKPNLAQQLPQNFPSHTPHSHASDARQKSNSLQASQSWSCRSLERPNHRPAAADASLHSPVDLRSPCPTALEQRPAAPMPVERWAENVNRYYNSQNSALSGRDSPCEELSELDSLYQASLKAPSMPRVPRGHSPQPANRTGIFGQPRPVSMGVFRCFCGKRTVN